MQEDNRVALMALHYLPAIGWITNLMKYPSVRLEKCEHFVKSSGRNRCEIGNAQGRQILSIPIAGGRGQQTPITELQISNEKAWQKHHWHALQTAYGKAPFFEDYAPYFEPFYSRPYDKLWDFNLDLLQLCLKLLVVQKELFFSDDYDKILPPSVVDFRAQNMVILNNPNTYYQGFASQTGFLPNLSCLDLLFQLGPDANVYLQTCVQQEHRA